MKYIKLLLVFIACQASAQIIPISGTTGNTTALLFPNQIIHVDIGSDNNVAVSVDESVPTVLKLRLAKEFGSITTNMLVITVDNLAYSFRISYSDSLPQYVYTIKKEQAVNAIKPVEPTTIKKDSIKKTTEIISDILESKNLLTRSDIAKKGKMYLVLKNIFIEKNELYYLFEIINKSAIKYTIDFYNFYCKTNVKKKLQGTVQQDIPIKFDFLNKRTDEITAHNSDLFILRTKKFTLEDGMISVFEIYEKEGGRHLRINITNNELLSATQL